MVETRNQSMTDIQEKLEAMRLKSDAQDIHSQEMREDISSLKEMLREFLAQKQPLSGSPPPDHDQSSSSPANHSPRPPEQYDPSRSGAIATGNPPRAPLNPHMLSTRLARFEFPKFDGTLFQEWIYCCEQFLRWHICIGCKDINLVMHINCYWYVSLLPVGKFKRNMLICTFLGKYLSSHNRLCCQQQHFTKVIASNILFCQLKTDLFNSKIERKRSCSPNLEAIKDATADILTGLKKKHITLQWAGKDCTSVEISGLDIGWGQVLANDPESDNAELRLRLTNVDPDLTVDERNKIKGYFEKI